MTGPELDLTEVRQLAHDIEAWSEDAIPRVRAVLQKGALNIKNDWRDRWKGMGNLPALAYAVTYDTEVTATAIEAEIGPDKNRRQGPLGNIAEFGTVNNAPHPGGGPALATEAPKFEKALSDVLGKVLR